MRAAPSRRHCYNIKYLNEVKEESGGDAGRWGGLCPRFMVTGNSAAVIAVLLAHRARELSEPDFALQSYEDSANFANIYAVS